MRLGGGDISNPYADRPRTPQRSMKMILFVALIGITVLSLQFLTFKSAISFDPDEKEDSGSAVLRGHNDKKFNPIDNKSPEKSTPSEIIIVTENTGDKIEEDASNIVNAKTATRRSGSVGTTTIITSTTSSIVPTTSTISSSRRSSTSSAISQTEQNISTSSTVEISTSSNETSTSSSSTKQTTSIKTTPAPTTSSSSSSASSTPIQSSQFIVDADNSKAVKANTGFVTDDDDELNTENGSGGEPHESFVAPVNVLQWKPPTDASIDKIYEWEDAVEETVLAISQMTTGGDELRNLLKAKKRDLIRLRKRLFNV